MDTIITTTFDIIRFLEEYERYPCLWQKSSIDFRNRVKREYAEEQLLPLTGFNNIKLLRQKIRNIRGTYNQEILKIKKFLASGEIYHPKLFWFPIADRFLRQNFEENGSDSNSRLPEYENRNDHGSEDSAAAYVIEYENQNDHENENSAAAHVEVEEVVYCESGKPTTLAKRPSRKRLVSSRKTLGSSRKTLGSSHPLKQVKRKVEDAVHALKAVGSQPLNEFTSFGLHIASQLQCLPAEEAITLQGDIQQLITAARLRTIRGTATRR